jgi:hypothetical protein
MKKSSLHRSAARLAVAIWAVLVVALIAQTAEAEEQAWSSTLFSYDFELDQAGSPPTVQATNPAAWSGSASSAQSTLTVVAEAGGQVLKYERVSGTTGIGGPRVDKQVSLEEGTRVRVDFRIRTLGNRYDLDLRGSSASNAPSTRLLALSGSGVVANPPTGVSFDANEYVHAAVVIDKLTGTYTSYLNDVPITVDAPLHTELDLNGSVLFRFSAVLNPSQHLTIDDVKIRSDAPGSLIEGLRAEHPRLMATADDFTALRARVQSDQVSGDWYDSLVVKAEALLTQPVSQYGFPDGRTLLQISRQVLDRTYILAMVYQVGGDERYAERLWEELEAAAAFPDWNPQSFLSTAEMTHAFAIGYDWLYDYWSSVQRQTLSDAIVSMGLQPGLTGYDNGEWWSNTTNNWNIVTNGGLGMGALAVGDVVPALAEEIITRGLGFLPTAIGEYAPDGAYPESVGYWAYATRYLVPYIAALETSLGNDFGLKASSGLAETGYFPLYMAGPSGRSFHYYDASGAIQQPPELFWLAEAYEEPVFSWWGSQGSGNSPRHLLWYDPTYLQTPEEAELPLDKYFRRSEVVTNRSSWNSPDAVFTGFKAGDNRSNHGDLDLGTFVLDALGVRWAEELGPEDYGVPGYWSDGVNGERWTYYMKRAEGQNTLVVNPGFGPDQSPLATGEIVRFESGPTETFSVADLSEAYEAHGVTSWQRGVKLFDHRRQVLVQDELQANTPVDAWWFMHTLADIEIAADGKSAMLSYGGEQLLARILTPSGGASFMVTDAAPLWTSPNPEGQTKHLGMRKLAISIEDTEELQLAVLFSPMPDGVMPVGGLPVIDSLQDWEIANSSVPQLAGISVDGVSVDGFAPGIFTYDIRMEAVNGPLPVISAVAESSQDQVTVQQANSFPGTASVSVEGPDGTQTRYEVRFLNVIHEYTNEQVTASINGTYPPSHTVDGKLSTFFSAQGAGQWVQYDLVDPQTVNGAALAWYQGDGRAFTFKVLTSSDAQNWTEVYSGMSSGNTLELEEHHFADTTARYVRIVGYGNTVNQWMSITEARILYDGGVWPSFEGVQPFLAGIILSGENTLRIGDTLQLSVDGELSDGAQSQVEAADVRYVSSNESVAVVNADGTVEGIGEGETRLSAILMTEDERLLHDTMVLTVTDPTRIILRPDADAYVRGGDFGDDNYGKTQSLILKEDNNISFRREAYVTFDVSEIEGEIESATLYVNGAVTTNGAELTDVHSIEIHALDVGELWEEETVTWNTRPTIQGHVASIPVTNVKQWGAADISSIVLQQQSEGNRLAFALLHDAPTGNRFAMQISSREHASLGPYLEVRLKPASELAAQLDPAAPSGMNGWYADPVTLSLTPGDSAEYRVDVTTAVYGSNPSTNGYTTYMGPVTLQEGVYEVTYRQAGSTDEADALLIKVDASDPGITFTATGALMENGTAKYQIDQNISILCSSSDALSGIAADSCGAPLLEVPAYSLDPGVQTVTATAEDHAGNAASAEQGLTVYATFDSLAALTQSFVEQSAAPGANGIAVSLTSLLQQARSASDLGNDVQKRNRLQAYVDKVASLNEDELTSNQSTVLIRWAHWLRDSSPLAGEALGQPVLSDDNGHDNGLRDGSYSVTMNMWWGTNGTEYRLYENGELIDEKLLADSSPDAQTTSTAVTGKANGTYTYTCELSNEFGITSCGSHVVTVTDAAPGNLVLSHNNWDSDGSYSVMMNMWWGVNGTEYRLFENGVQIDLLTLQASTPQPQSAVTLVSGRTPGVYEYRAELANSAGGSTVSQPITVVVSE